MSPHRVVSQMPMIVKDSLTAALAVVAAIGTVMSVTGVTMAVMLPGVAWWVCLLVLVVFFFLCFLSVLAVKKFRSGRLVSLEIGGNDVQIVVGDLFKRDGWKVIPFNERFDTQVDDVVIAKKSLNGVFIEKQVVGIDLLREVIAADEGSPLLVTTGVGRAPVYELGYVKRYAGEYLLLAFTHFDSANRAHLTISEYESCLMNMWGELSRVYAGKPINLPLLGAGITRFDGSQGKSFDALLRCMLCTLRMSGLKFDCTITIVLTSESVKRMHPYEAKIMAGNGF